MTAMQLDWKFGPEGLKELGSVPVYVLQADFGLVFFSYASVLLQHSALASFVWAPVPYVSDAEYERAESFLASHLKPQST